MKNPELFHKTVGILVNAYLNDTLEHANCNACAVGNMVAANKGIRLYNEKGFVESDADHNENSQWFWAIGTGKPFWSIYNSKEMAKEQVDSTGYKLDEIAKIEFAFENVTNDIEEDPSGYLGLMAVVDVLIKIHKGSKTEKSTAKSLFKKELTEVG